MKRFTKYFIGAVALSLAMTVGTKTATACEECQMRKTGTYLGQFTLLGNGTVRTWVKYEGGKPTTLGVTFSETALSGLANVEDLPKDMPMMAYSLALPKEARITGFDHVVLDWNPAGHVPSGVYDLPHFDVHFYLTSPDELNKITLIGEDKVRAAKKPAPQFLPADYITPPGTEVPRMGAHAIDGKTAELNGQTFTHTLLYGYYDGQVTFIEPMITRAFLETKPDITVPIKQPAVFQKRGYYPTHYSIKYDSVRQEYTVALEGLTLRPGITKIPDATKTAATQRSVMKVAATKTTAKK